MAKSKTVATCTVNLYIFIRMSVLVQKVAPPFESEQTYGATQTGCMLPFDLVT